MAALSIGDIVQATGATMTGNVGTVVSYDEQRERFLVRIDAVTQNWFPEGDLRRFDPSAG